MITRSVAGSWICWSRSQTGSASRGGVYGSRMTGGGFGGSTVSLVDAARVETIGRRIAEAYVRQIGVEAGVLTSRPARGTHVVA